MYTEYIKLVYQSDTPCTRLDWENLLYPKPNIESIVDHLSFSNLEVQNYIRWGINQLHSGYLYIQNIKLVCQSDTPCTRKIYFTPSRILSQWSITLAFSNLEDQNYTRWGKLGINQLHSTSTFRISNWFVSLTHHACTRLDRENLVYTQPNTELIVDHLSFFKPRRPKLY